MRAATTGLVLMECVNCVWIGAINEDTCILKARTSGALESLGTTSARATVVVGRLVRTGMKLGVTGSCFAWGMDVGFLRVSGKMDDYGVLQCQSKPNALLK